MTWTERVAKWLGYVPDPTSPARISALAEEIRRESINAHPSNAQIVFDPDLPVGITYIVNAVTVNGPAPERLDVVEAMHQATGWPREVIMDWVAYMWRAGFDLVPVDARTD